MRTVIDETIFDTTDPLFQEVAKRMESKFKKYWGNLEKMNKLVFLGHILDPRYKLQMIGFHLGDMKLDASKIQSFVDGLKNCLMELHHAYKMKVIYNPLLDDINGIDDGDIDKDLMEMYKNDPIKLNYHMKMAQAQ
ncbi:zinc finger BED domain-containing protein RICESLEEPER 1-like [Zingiber officinale]|uniref:zinc finger BED domain-containing protein RICESLEEPER 1-like n=1 Tax=Zingiber officinale TaxID=94328 RepID=UPI001C4AEC12|nr:zinc finger BED domain-containing protein RICESLEEPER 1-like [Zingiber officinale]